MEKLDLSYNRIVNLYRLKNAKFLNLKVLILSSCNIYDIDDIRLRDFPFTKLEVLKLEYNNISYFDYGIFKNALVYLRSNYRIIYQNTKYRKRKDD